MTTKDRILLLWLVLITSVSICLLPETGYSKKVFLNPSDQFTNPVCGGGNEAEYALAAANQAKAVLEAAGHVVKVVQGFTGIPSQSNSWGAEAFVSMHTNALNGGCSSNGHGLIVFYNYDHKASDVVIAQKVDEQLNSQLSGQMSCGWYNRGYRDWFGKNLYVLSSNNAPCCLEEALFHDCTTEAAFLRSTNGQTRIGKGVANGVIVYFGGVLPPNTLTEVKVVVPEGGGEKGTINPDLGKPVSIYFKGERAGKYTLRIFTQLGEEIYSETKDVTSAEGWFEWTPKRDLASGVYFVYVEGPGVKTYKKIVLLR